ncbi:MAG TPA: FecR family protein [Pseudosphingobacterium sp.]|nr:FecR family protein [Pseudosphingobacterium sp.]
MEEKELNALLERYLAGTASEKDKAIIEAWFEEVNEKPFTLSSAQLYPISQKMLEEIARKTDYKQNKRNIFYLTAIWKVAATILLTFFIYLTYQWVFHKNRPSTKEMGAPLFVYHTLPGQKAKLTLPDSSIIWLNGNSSIRYRKNLTDTMREIFLDKGEAFFAVKEEIRRPFLVHTTDIDTKVLGTSFNIKALDYEGNYVLSVSTGAVQVKERHGKRRILGNYTSGKQLIYNNLDKSYQENRVKISDFIAWKDQVLIFRDASFLEVKQQLEDWYNIKIKFTRPFPENIAFTATFKNESLHTVLKALSKINPFTYTINDKEVLIKH